LAECLYLLVVEDSETEINEWKKRVERHNAAEDRAFDIEIGFAESKRDAEKLIQGRRFDAAVVDLRLKLEGQGQGNNDDGNDVVRMLASGEMAAVAVYTGQPVEAERERFNSPNIEVLDKGFGLDVVFTWLKNQSDLIFVIRKATKIIGQDMALTFHRSVWPRWKQWCQGGDIKQSIELPLARHLVSHVYTQLLGETGSVVHPEEHYYVPSFPDRDVSTGDLICETSSGMMEVVITPRCDIAHANRMETIQLATCMDASAEWEKYRAADSTTSAKEILKMKQHSRKEVQHFLPAMTIEPGKSLGPWFVRFDQIRSIDKKSDEFNALKNKRIASISTDFLPSLVQRLGAFFSRIGTPDLL